MPECLSSQYWDIKSEITPSTFFRCLWSQLSLQAPISFHSFPALFVSVLDFVKITSVMIGKGLRSCLLGYLKVISRIGIFIAGDDLRGHPVRRSNEGVSPAHRSVQLGTDTKIHCGSERQQDTVRLENTRTTILLTVKHYINSHQLPCRVRREIHGQRHSCLISAGINWGQSRTNLIIWCPGFVRDPVPFPPCQEAMKRNHSSSY